MDNRELINYARSVNREWGAYGCDILSGVLRDVTDALEKNLVERDAAVEELRGDCWCCAHGKPWEVDDSSGKMTFCEHLKECGAIATTGKAHKCQHWQ